MRPRTQRVDVMGDTLSPLGRYFAWCNNIDLRQKCRVEMNGVVWYVLPFDEATVYNEMLELLYIERNDLKKLDTAGKLDAIADKDMAFSADFEQISYEDGLKRMGPVRNQGLRCASSPSARSSRSLSSLPKEPISPFRMTLNGSSRVRNCRSEPS